MDIFKSSLCFAAVLCVCFFLGRFLRPSKGVAARVLGFMGLLFLGPFVFTIAFTGLLVLVFGDAEIQPAMLYLLAAGALLSPFVIRFGMSRGVSSQA